MKPTKHATTNYRRLLALIEGDNYRRYEELRKQRPGIVAEKSIEKGRWE